MSAKNVTQADREAAARAGLDMTCLNERDANVVRQGGQWDEWPLVQAFARHREASQAELRAVNAELAWEVERLRVFVTELANNPRKPATWMQTREAAALLLAGITRAKASRDA